ncbi:MAG: hypothetical protein ABFD92_00550 [Planctomycetaceae bacterium]|nr:hypothetical protein [Planctomycetaceae bacterium]
MEEYALRYSGRRWEIVYARYEGVQQFAVDELQRTLQRYLPYVVAVRAAGTERPDADVHRILIGTAAGHAGVAECMARGHVDKPQGAGAYSIAVFKKGEASTAVIAGADEGGVLHGAMDFCGRVLGLGVVEEKPDLQQAALDRLAEVRYATAAAIDNRGIWTWGYVIYDYQRFIDNMARLRMNMLTIWNDQPPLNAPQIIEYAHSRGVKIVLGFHWGWGLEKFDIFSKPQRDEIRRGVVENYRRNYAHLKADGIYFQTSTEHTTTARDGVTTAKAACMLVNETARELLDEQGDLYIQFGLHATSIQDRFGDLADLDHRVTIVWEDAGALPYTYGAEVNPDAVDEPGFPRTPEGTIEYSRKLATFRPGTEFALVPKGWTALRWDCEFEHHGPFILGQRDETFVASRLQRRQRWWDAANSAWLRNYPLAARFYREMLACKPPKITATALIEDGVFEARIQSSAALLGQILWDPRRDDGEILRQAMSPYYR